MPPVAALAAEPVALVLAQSELPDTVLERFCVDNTMLWVELSLLLELLVLLALLVELSVFVAVRVERFELSVVVVERSELSVVLVDRFELSVVVLVVLVAVLVVVVGLFEPLVELSVLVVGSLELLVELLVLVVVLVAVRELLGLLVELSVFVDVLVFVAVSVDVDVLELPWVDVVFPSAASAAPDISAAKTSAEPAARYFVRIVNLRFEPREANPPRRRLYLDLEESFSPLGLLSRRLFIERRHPYAMVSVRMRRVGARAGFRARCGCERTCVGRKRIKCCPPSHPGQHC
jgi:hypothetical protein